MCGPSCVVITRWLCHYFSGVCRDYSDTNLYRKNIKPTLYVFPICIHSLPIPKYLGRLIITISQLSYTPAYCCCCRRRYYYGLYRLYQKFDQLEYGEHFQFIIFMCDCVTALVLFFLRYFAFWLNETKLDYSSLIRK